MKNSIFSNPALDEITFEHRNHAYGAFAIRKNYDKNMSKAVVLAVLFFVSAFLSPGIFESLTQKNTLPLFPEEFIVHEFAVVPTIERVKIQSSNGNPTHRQESNLSNIEEPTIVVPDEEPLVDQQEVNPDNTNSDNDALINTNFDLNDPTGISTGAGVGFATEHTGNNESNEDIYLVPDELPVFGEDKSALNKYLLKNINIPQIAKDNQIEGKVIIEFIIEKNGEVKSIHVLRGIGAGCDEELIRVLEKMPKWKAGKHHGKPVNVKLILPVAFSYH